MRSSKTILVADDQPAIRRSLELKLAAAGYRVICAADGREALDLIRRDRPDAVVADITMPHLDGRSLCEMTDTLKAERPFLTVIVTGRIGADEREWTAHMHDTVFMEKPFSPTRLQEAVDRYFGITS